MDLQKMAEELEADPQALDIGKGSQAWRFSRLHASSGSATPSSLDKLLLPSGFLIAKKIKSLGNIILGAHPVIYRFYDCLARKEYIQMFLPDVEKRALDWEREQLVLVLPSWTIMGKSFNFPEAHFCICEGGTIGRMN